MVINTPRSDDKLSGEQPKEQSTGGSGGRQEQLPPTKGNGRANGGLDRSCESALSSILLQQVTRGWAVVGEGTWPQ